MNLDFYYFSINIDTSFINVLGTQSFLEILWYFFVHGGWIFLIFIILIAAWNLWINSRQAKFAASGSNILLAIDVPKRNEQSLKAVENIFAQMAGVHSGPTKWEKYFKGAYQKGFSLEIVSIDGFIQFLIRTPAEFRDLIEASVYAQYPDAEITEVADYAKEMVMTFPNDKYNMWGSEIILAEDQILPIRTYPEFEDTLSQEFKDPLAAILEILAKLKKGEQLWLQILITPTDFKWKKEGEKKIKELMGDKPKVKKTVVDKLVELPMYGMDLASDILGGAPGEEKKEESPKQMMFVPPIEKSKIDGILRKISKIGFKSKIRMVYVGKHEVFAKPRGVAAVFGAIKQFNTLDMNSFKPDSNETTKAEYAFKKWRYSIKQNRIYRRYIGRAGDGAKKYILNIEELATLFHFPNDFVKAPLIKKTESRKAEPPMSLPVADAEQQREIEEKTKEFFYKSKTKPKSKKEESKDEKEEIRLKTTGSDKAIPGIDFETDYFEKRFAKKKSKNIETMLKQSEAEHINNENSDNSDAPPNLPIQK